MGQLCPIGTWGAQWVSHDTDVQHTSQKAQQALFFKYGGKALRAHHEWFQVIVPLLIHRCFAAFCKYTLGLVLVVRRRRMINCCFVSFCLFRMVLSCIVWNRHFDITLSETNVVIESLLSYILAASWLLFSGHFDPSILLLHVLICTSFFQHPFS